MIDSQTLKVVDSGTGGYPEWPRLEFNKCGHCSLSEETTPHCPLSTSISSAVRRFEDILSYEEIEVEVVTERRAIRKSLTAQQGLSALLGLIMATSGFPHTAYFKPMARFHLPFATEDETVDRAASLYLLSQYFRND
ncbi:TPA: hypothetical protein DCE37_17980 [Candidatus Latescibacteria bacterium]|nr:hypothetical protein [Candidatus Latescibacterota bacterium]